MFLNNHSGKPSELTQAFKEKISKSTHLLRINQNGYINMQDISQPKAREVARNIRKDTTITQIEDMLVQTNQTTQIWGKSAPIERKIFF